jgi:ABC-2 type transport system ATP-binding protein
LRKEFRRSDGKRSGLRRKRERVDALRGISFEIARGECVAILGQNGSGKSTLVRLLSTLLLLDGGSATIFGHDISDTRAVRRLVNRVSVEASFFKKMSSTENLSYAARFYGLTAGQTRDEIPRILERVGFPADRRNEAMEDLSRGMQQKVALARALLTQPILLLLDEPTTGLDPRSKLEVQDFIREVRRTHDSTILLCTHDLAEAEVLAVHWVAFFQSINVSSVAIGLLSFSSFPLFTAALEPILLRQRLRGAELAGALLVLPGIYLLVPSLSLSDTTVDNVSAQRPSA